MMEPCNNVPDVIVVTVGAEVDRKSIHGVTALFGAAARGHLGVVQVLVYVPAHPPRKSLWIICWTHVRRAHYAGLSCLPQ